MCINIITLLFPQNKKQVDSTFDEENLVVCTFELFVAGSETTSTTLSWALLYMAKYPEIQGKSYLKENFGSCSFHIVYRMKKNNILTQKAFLTQTVLREIFRSKIKQQTSI